MKDFLLVYRTDQETMHAMPKRSPEEMQANTKKWMDWIGGIAAQNKLSDRGNRLFPEGKVIGQNGVISDGPFTEIKESIIGYSIVRAGSLDEAVKLSEGCPVLATGGSVEVREINSL